MGVLLRGGTVVSAQGMAELDVLLEGKKSLLLGKASPPGTRRRWTAPGCCCFPASSMAIPISIWKSAAPSPPMISPLEAALPSGVEPLW